MLRNYTILKFVDDIGSQSFILIFLFLPVFTKSIYLRSRTGDQTQVAQTIFAFRSTAPQTGQLKKPTSFEQILLPISA